LGKHALLYNPNNIPKKGVKEAVLGDLFHGMSNDSTFKSLKEDFALESEKAG
jgi:hypothetical protein